MSAMTALLEYLIVFLLLAGGAFSLVGSYGLAKLSDFYKRLHGPSKATTLGVGGVLLASLLLHALRGDESNGRELLITLFLFLTAPVSAYTLGRAALALRPQDRPPKPESQATPD